MWCVFLLQKNNTLYDFMDYDSFEYLKKLFTEQQNSRLVQIQSPCRRQNKCDSKFEICFGKGIETF